VKCNGCSVAKCSESLSNRVSKIIRRYMYIHHMKFAAYMALLFITFFHILSVPFLSLYIWLYVFILLYNFVNYKLYFYCYIYAFLLLFMVCFGYSVSMCCSVYCFCVNVYCITATGSQPNYSSKNMSYNII